MKTSRSSQFRISEADKKYYADRDKAHELDNKQHMIAGYALAIYAATIQKKMIEGIGRDPILARAEMLHTDLIDDAFELGEYFYIKQKQIL